MSAQPQTYRFEVEGHLDQHWASWFGDATITHHDGGRSTLVATLIDQAELHGVLARLRDLGITLIALTPTPSPHQE